MSNTVIKVENLSKQYRLGLVGSTTLGDDIKRWWASARGKEDPFLKIGESNDRSKKGESDYVWSLRDINFEVKQGDTLGIIGRNGAGKSTLLKILSKVTAPTTGNVKVKGRIASLLEVGTGFHPELTGRENIYLNGAILGMRKHEIKRKFDEIVDFSGVERYIDTPVKRYSSGMYVRLAFAVAAHLESEILIVDEVLAVGDAEFQKKCLGKMGEVSKGEGRTVLFVSHNMAAVQNLCKSGILLERGFVKLNASIPNIVEGYLNQNKSNDFSGNVSLENAIRSNGKSKVIQKIWIENKIGEISSSIMMGEAFSIVIEFKSKDPIVNALFGFGIENSQGERITSLNNEISGDKIPTNVLEGKVVLKINNPNIMDGIYFVSVSIVSNQIVWIDYIEQAISFEIIPADVYSSGKLIDKTQGNIFMNGSIDVF